MKKSRLKKILLLTILYLSVANLKATVYSVTATTDAGTGTAQSGDLRYCINTANGDATAGPHQINFALPGSGPYSIILTSSYTVSRDMIIDATTQIGYIVASPTPMVELKNSPAQAFVINSGVSATGTTIKGFIINRCNAQGILIQSPNNTIVGNYIGTDATGMVSSPNQASAILLNGCCAFNANGNIIGGNTKALRNVISGNNNAHGIECNTSSNNIIIGNYIGLNWTGTAIISNSYHGINVYGTVTGYKIGGLTIDSSNVISGNGQDGISFGNVSNSRIIGNLIGTAANGNTNFGNGQHGIFITSCSNILVFGNTVSGNQIGINAVNNGIAIILKKNYIGTSSDGLSSIGNSIHGIQVQGASGGIIIGGNRVTEGNIISNSGVHGINLDPGADGSIIKGNIVGSDINGTAHMGNGVIGIVAKSNNLIIGGTSNNEGNIIVDSKAPQAGCGLLLANANNALVNGNYIGLGADGITPLPNTWDGINISVEIIGQTASNNIIRNNVIAYNLNNGISVGKSLGSTIDNHELNNDLRFNSIFCNKQLGIALDLTNPADEGNHGKIAPLINNALSTSSKIVGIANGLLPTDSVDIYEMVNCLNCDLNPQGKKYIATVLPDVAGDWSYNNGSPIAGILIATVTDVLGNTSQFSLCFTPCKAVAVVNPTTFTVQLEMNSAVPVTLTSSSTFSPINPIPGKIFWSLNKPDTTGAALFSTANSVNFNFSTTGAAGDHGPGLYTIYLIAKQTGCMDTVEARLNIFFIPNVVTPNGDNHNDQWSVGNAPGQFDAKIYNRWGDLVYSKSDYTNEWNGDGLSDGVYFYLLEDKTQSKKSFKGWVQIMK